MCFSPQRRAILQARKCKERVRTCQRPSAFWDFDFERCFSSHSQEFLRHLNVQKWSKHSIFLRFWLGNDVPATASWDFLTWKLAKVLSECRFFNILTCKCASRHSGVQFFDIRTSKSGPNLTCFVHFDFKMCFSPQRRAIFDFSAEHLPPHPPL